MLLGAIGTLFFVGFNYRNVQQCGDPAWGAKSTPVNAANAPPNPFGNAFYGAGSGLIRGGLGAYGENFRIEL